MFWQVLEMHTWELATLPCFVRCLCVPVCGLRWLCVFGRAEEGVAAWHRRITKTKARTVQSHVQKVDEAREAASLKRAVARESLIEAGMHALVAAGKVLESEGQALERIIERSQPGTRAHEAAVKRAGRTAFQKGLRQEPRGHNMDILKRVPGLKLYIETLVSELGGRANERRDSPLVHIRGGTRRFHMQ